MMQPHEENCDVGWERLRTREAFLAAFGDRPIHGSGMVFTIHSSGTLTGRVGALDLNGEWHWEDGLFCRRASLDGTDLGLDREVIEKRGAQMRYTGAGGSALPVVVSLERA